MMPPKALKNDHHETTWYIYCEDNNIFFFQKSEKPIQATWQATAKTEMPQRHYTAIETSQNPQTTSMIYTSFGMWSIGPA